MAFDPGLPAQAVIEALGWTLLDFVWQGVLITFAYALLRMVLATRSASWRLGAGYLALAGFAIAPVLTLFGHLGELQMTAGLSGVAEAAAPSGAIALGTLNALTWSLDPLLPYVVNLWIAGVAFLVLRGLWRWRDIRRICLSAQPLSTPWQQRIAALHGRVGLRVKVLVRESAQVAAPILVGWIKPTVLLPLGLCARMPIDQLELILTHEFAHVRRFDAWANAAQLALETLLFYHPAVHWVGRRVREDRELCCDELVTALGGDALTYARALLALAEGHRDMDTGNLALAATGGALLGRVEHLLGVPRRQQEAPTLIRLEGLLPAALISMGVMMLANPFESPLIDDQPAGHALRMAPIALAQPSMEMLAPMLDIVVRDLQPRIAGVAVAIAQSPDAGPSLIAPSSSEIETQPSAALVATRATSVESPNSAGLLDGTAPADSRRTAAPHGQPAQASGELDTPEALRVIKRTSPFYPRSPLARGIEGQAELSFRVDRHGNAVDIQVVKASQKAFGVSAVDALERWRFDPAQSSARRHVQGFDFNLPTADSEGRCLQSTGTRLCRRIP